MIINITAGITKGFGDVPTCFILFCLEVDGEKAYKSSLWIINSNYFFERQHMDDAGPISTSIDRDELGVNDRTLLTPDALPIPTLDSIVQ